MEKLIRDKGFSKSQIIEGIDEWVVGQNAERNREITKRKLIDGVSYMTLSEEFDLSLRRVKTIVKKSTNMIIERLEENK